MSRVQIHWTKPNGMAVTTNDRPENIAEAEDLGWVRAEAPPAAPDTVEQELASFLSPPAATG